MAEPDVTEPLIDTNAALLSYYDSLESRIGYRLLLGGTRHLVDFVPRHLERARRTVHKANLEKGITVKRMDYHHLESIASESHDGVYTLETFVHATDPEGVLDGFYRILKPGGRVVLYHYDTVPDGTDVLEHFKTEMKTANKYAAMPTNDRAGQGFYQEILGGAGFVDVEVEDLSANIRPMLLLFCVLAMLPYLIIKLLRLEKYLINTVVGATAYRGQPYWRYVAACARKPVDEEEK
ncbi:hypothetical protein NKR19_g10374 [Coniochaeta hoffmannii]|uniref:Methyltransferase type 11 domain-containing protein n=1 Tax=Coniochaeta hoffmannii TaxID=91930 RepID=A0AA38RDT1_9PEZI|nr:hypothetical protein NKR19_g10374 [Coniochaeta hoffmannii]